MVDVRWDGVSHEQIHTDINNGQGASASSAHAQAWDGVAKSLERINGDLQAELSRLGAVWEGKAADNTKAGSTPLVQWSETTNGHATNMKTTAEWQGNFIGEARSGVPKPVQVTTPEPSTGDYMNAYANPFSSKTVAGVEQQARDHEAQEKARREAEQKARQAMTSYQSSSDMNVNTMATFETPPQVVVGVPEPQPRGGQVGPPGVGVDGPNGSTNTSSAPTLTGAGGSVPGAPGTGGGGTGPGGHVPGAPGTGGPGGPGPGGYPGAPGTTNPGGWSPIRPQNTGKPPTTNTPPNLGPNSGQEYGMPGPFGPGGTSFGDDEAARRGGPGSRGVGGPGGLGGANADGQRAGKGGPGGFGGMGGADDMAHRAGGAGGPGGRGAGGMGGGMPMGGARGQGEEDEEHETPDYLIGASDVWGDDRKVAPPVIGEKPQQK
ncbi:PPE-repeat protein [Herbihabitans rhizosphaerae]|uniref:PPE-repeat protein n=1 Tax=Herbihabitans rhizosphaerae TaxID=1872711 RepID=A0A4Q7KXH9_9PSEU|nr:PPE domain-containing protein [Herbihabitans rhizosphaerae]RZS41356.1 PPE-repeat protein [Herbihabitans rhizosphaerae]